MFTLIFSIVLFILALITVKYKQKNKLRIIFDIFVLLIFCLISIAYIAADYFTGSGITQSVLSTLSLGLSGAGYEEYFLLIVASFFGFILFFVVAFFYYRHLHDVKQPNPKKIKAFLHNSFLISAFLMHPFFSDVSKIYQVLTTEQSDDFYSFYVLPNNHNKLKDFKQKNIVYIYAESLERTYFDSLLFPDLVPNLDSIIKKNGIDFSDIRQVYGTWFTIAGIVSSQCGIPLLTTSHGNSMSGIDQFYPKAVCLGDVLKKDGYYLSFIQGARLSFGGKNKFFSTHKFDEMKGYDEFVGNLEDKSYQHGWGLYDDITLQNAYDEFEKLSLTQDKFALFTLTLDTHHPNGHLSNSCSDNLYLDGTNEILNTVKCSDKLISEFINKIQNSKYANNTLIVISSDHLAMRNTASEMLKDVFDRTNLFVVLDPSNKQYKNIEKTGTMFDVASTLLGFIGIDTDLGLGRNLMKKESIYGLFEDFDKQIPKWREDILDFWSFPKLSSTIYISPEKKNVKIIKNNYSLPILIKIDEKDEIQPFFEFDGYVKLFEEFSWLKMGEKFLWIDKCETINFIFNTDYTQEYCMSQGIFGGNISIEGIENEQRYEVVDFKNDILNDDFYQEKLKRIELLRKKSQ
ncbi:sulfatase-like hydrolase/transferase [Arcobacter sp. FWKO B]|uniref:sulfatase-like hydrolase/transferase n=1 Tax=Arcobacter sp. FWKO B TaxID=2593672 RepID=UPI0018A60B83|nr:sulfatase-like hydrolase/transferase [Arcobacter sp. FWKO B]QOG11576.1 sulfatase-like hydrolase/transferase [Arcobacter sp. FWKO B]